jgi:hypothetical protein
MLDNKNLFQRWFVNTLDVLSNMPEGDGGWVALAILCPLYERYAVAVIKKAGGKADKDGKIAQFMIDFEVDKTTATAFWTMVRDGIMHQAMPLVMEHGKHSTRCMLRDGDNPVWMGKYTGRDCLFVQPWHFKDRVLQLWNENMSLLDQSNSFPWANIVRIEAKDFE